MEKAAIKQVHNLSFSNMTVNLSSGDLVSESGCFHGDSVAIKVTRILPYCFIMIVSLIGNSMVVAVVQKNQRMRTTVNFYIVNMAIADLMITLYMPRMFTMAMFGFEWVVDGTAGFVFCKLSILLNQTPMIVSIFTVVAISFDRFNAVVFPLKTFVSQRLCKVVIACMWLLALSFRIPTVYAVRTMTGRDGKLYCNLLLDDTFGEVAKRVYYHFNMIAIFSIPLLTIVILYSTIIVTLKRRKAPGLTPENSSNNSEGFRRREVVKKKVLRLVSIVVIAFVLCWFLYYVRLSMYAYGHDLPCDWLHVRLVLAHFNSALNPCLYAIFSENYRRGFKKILARFYCRRKRPWSHGGDSLGSLRRRQPAWDSNGSISIRIENEIQKISTL